MKKPDRAVSRAGSLNRNPTVLLVDDEPSILRALRRLLSQEPYELHTRVDPKDALDLVRRRPINLLITDQRMPEMSGVELVKAVHKASPGTAVVILTAFPDRAVVIERTSLRIERLLTKPWDDDQLKRNILDILERQAKSAGNTESALGVRQGDAGDSSFRIDCWGMSAREVLAAMASAFNRSESPKGGPVLVIENLGFLKDSVSRVVNELARLGEKKNIRVMIDDRSGYLEALLDAIEGASCQRITEPH